MKWIEMIEGLNPKAVFAFCLIMIVGIIYCFWQLYQLEINSKKESEAMRQDFDKKIEEAKRYIDSLK